MSVTLSDYFKTAGFHHHTLSLSVTATCVKAGGSKASCTCGTVESIGKKNTGLVGLLGIVGVNRKGDTGRDDCVLNRGSDRVFKGGLERGMI